MCSAQYSPFPKSFHNEEPPLRQYAINKTSKASLLLDKLKNKEAENLCVAWKESYFSINKEVPSVPTYLFLNTLPDAFYILFSRWLFRVETSVELMRLKTVLSRKLRTV